jgi:hypothetical protein
MIRSTPAVDQCLGKAKGAANLLGYWKEISLRPLLTSATLLGCWGFASWLVAASAGEVRMVEESGSSYVVVDTSDANSDEVLAMLAAHFEFAIEPSARTGQPVRYSGRLEGSLDQLLERLLRHQGHLIVRSAQARAGISLVVLLEAKGGAPAPTVAGAVAALKAKLKLQEPTQSRDKPGE